jgi:hypothetical protein
MLLGSLVNYYYKNNCIISAPSQPTRFPVRNPAGAEILDFAIVSKVSNVLSNHSERSLGSLSTIVSYQRKVGDYFFPELLAYLVI